MKTSVVNVSKLRKLYPAGKKVKAFLAVDDISFTLHEGEVLGLLGPNGAGKSTTISMLLGSLTPTSGRIEYFGKDFVKFEAQVLQHVAFASTYIKMPWRLSVMENLRVYGYLYGLSKDQFERRAKKFLSRFGVWEQRNKTMNNLSAGQTTRVMLSKAFIPHPKIVLLDEPTASLDPEIAHQIRGFIKEQQKEFNTSILYTSHNMDEVADVCDRVMFMKKGRIVSVDTPKNLIGTLKDVTVTLLLTAPEKVDLKLFESLAKSCQLVERELIVTLEEIHVSLLFRTLAKSDIDYSQLSVRKPTLEDYFLTLTK